MGMVIDMKFKSLYFALFGMALVADAWAINVVDGKMNMLWGAPQGEDFGDKTPGAFVIAGGLGKEAPRGTWKDEKAIVGVIAMEIVEHGGYFCPIQLQCANKDSGKLRKSSWSTYYYPSGYSAEKCVWLCKPGYTGIECAEQTNIFAGLAAETNTTGLFSGISLKTSGNGSGGIESLVPGFASWGYKGDLNKAIEQKEKDVLLGVVEFKKHGVMVAPVSIECAEDGKESFVNRVATYSNYTPQLLCAEGYGLDSTATDCVPLTEEILNLQKEMNGTSGQPKKQMCSGWTDSGYDSAIHSIDSTGECIKFMCKDKTKAFPAPGNYECMECAGSVRGGQNPLTGLCVVCEQVGQYFNSQTNLCDTAIAFTRIDMQYGKGKTKDSYNRTDDQCWTKVSPDEYKDCVFGKSAPVLSSIKLGGVIPLNIGLANAYTVSTSINSTNSNSTGTTSTNSNNNYTGGALVHPGVGGGSSAPAVPQYNNGSYANNPYANQSLRMDTTRY